MIEKTLSPLLELTRGDTIESIHCGAIAVVNPGGELLHSYGDPHSVTFLRSAAKPFQVMPFIEAGGHHHYHLTPRDIALMCASHSGTDEHFKVLSGIQDKTGVAETDLMCGVHPPYDKTTAEDLIRRGEKPTANRHNCSGKHTGMLAYARMNGEELPTYLETNHPIQTRILRCLSELSGASTEEIRLGTDGCSAPNFALSLYHSALAWARLADPSDLSSTRAEACRTITRAMTAHPFMVGGPNRFDTQLMALAEGKIVIKAGAEGYEGIGILPGALGPGSPGLGVALKISDGDGYGRARAAVSLEVLHQLGVLTPDQLEALAQFGPRRPVKNWRKLDVGEMRPVFELMETKPEIKGVPR
jgi:L-asparaginase II